MFRTRKLLIVIATFNELENLPPLVYEIHSLLPEAEILIVDDNSPDGTGRWCDEFKQDHHFLRVSHRERKLGLGTAAIAGLKSAINENFDFVATMDADLSHEPASLKEMYDSIRSPEHETTGVLIGSRYIKGGRIIGWPWYRKIASRVINWYSRLLLGLNTNDNTSAFRLYRVSKLRSFDLNLVQSTGYAYLEEILLILKRAGVQIAEYPITFRNRGLGCSKVSLSELGNSLFQIFKLSFRPTV